MKHDLSVPTRLNHAIGLHPRAWRARAGDEAGGALGASSCERSEDLPGSGAVRSFVAAGYFASDNGGPQLAFGQIIGRIDAIVIQKGEEMIALFIEPIAHGFFVGFAVGQGQCLAMGMWFNEREKNLFAGHLFRDFLSSRA